jgi:hypothetical protein
MMMAKGNPIERRYAANLFIQTLPQDAKRGPLFHRVMDQCHSECRQSDCEEMQIDLIQTSKRRLAVQNPGEMQLFEIDLMPEYVIKIDHTPKLEMIDYLDLLANTMALWSGFSIYFLLESCLKGFHKAIIACRDAYHRRLRIHPMISSSSELIT